MIAEMLFLDESLELCLFASNISMCVECATNLSLFTTMKSIFSGATLPKRAETFSYTLFRVRTARWFALSLLVSTMTQKIFERFPNLRLFCCTISRNVNWTIALVVISIIQTVFGVTALSKRAKITSLLCQSVSLSLSLSCKYCFPQHSTSTRKVRLTSNKVSIFGVFCCQRTESWNNNKRNQKIKKPKELRT